MSEIVLFKPGATVEHFGASQKCGTHFHGARVELNGTDCRDLLEFWSSFA
jgi:hypothetical protein